VNYEALDEEPRVQVLSSSICRSRERGDEKKNRALVLPSDEQWCIFNDHLPLLMRRHYFCQLCDISMVIAFKRFALLDRKYEVYSPG